jgi:uncharacterized protein YbjT (DUF2867 family)
MKKALVVGASGLVGRILVDKLLENDNYSTVKILVRKPLFLSHPKLIELIVDFANLNTKEIEADDIFCCLGSTMKKAGSKKKFFAIDFTLPLQIAKAAKENGAKQFLLISAMEANPNSIFYYGKVKGKIEAALSKLNFETLLIFRPSLLLGNRNESDKRLGESLAIIFMTNFSFLLSQKIKPIEAKKVAQAMLETAQKGLKNKVIFESNQLQKFSR